MTGLAVAASVESGLPGREIYRRGFALLVQPM
jgi:hypothetical protein